MQKDDFFFTQTRFEPNLTREKQRKRPERPEKSKKMPKSKIKFQNVPKNATKKREIMPLLTFPTKKRKILQRFYPR